MLNHALSRMTKKVKQEQFEKAPQETYRKAQMILEKGSDKQRLVLLNKGTVQVGRTQAGRIPPPRLIDDVQRFKRDLAKLDHALLTKKIKDVEAQIEASRVCSALVDSFSVHLRQQKGLAKEISTYVFHETFPFFMSSRMAERTFSKPRGYAGDYLTIELIYQNKPTGHGRLGRFIDGWWLSQPAVQAMRNRRGFFTKVIHNLLKHWKEPSPMPITSLASGSAREISDVFSHQENSNLHITCVDIDHEALAFTKQLCEEHGIGDRMTLLQNSPIRVARGKEPINLAPQQLIYSVGLIDYLEDVNVIQLLNWIYDNLLPGGRVVLGNFDVSNPDRAFMDHIIKGVLIHRTSKDLRRIFSHSKFGQSPVMVRIEDSGVNLFAFCKKH